MNVARVRDPAPRAAVPGMLSALMERMHDEDVLYCHWKSNHTLGASLRGELDVDLLVDAAAGATLTRLLADVGFKPAVVPWLTYPATDHFLALDRHTGRLCHLHVYYRLITGTDRLKSHHLPWEHLVLSTRQWDAAHGMYVSDPTVGMILFAVRAALRLPAGAWLLGATHRPAFGGGGLAEFRWLSERVDIARIDALGRTLLGGRATRSLLGLLTPRPSLRRLLAFRRDLAAALHPHRRYGPVEATVHKWLRDGVWALQVANRRWLHSPFVCVRSLATGGCMVALVGPDGSGKSTLARAIVAWLSPHLSAYPVYFGSGDGTISLLRLPLRVAAWVVRNRPMWRPRGGPGRPDGARAVPRGPLERIARVLWALTVAYEKRGKLRRAWRAHERGAIVVCDRFPQNQVMGYMDGPLLSDWRHSRFRLLRALARWEQAPYAWADAHAPDLVIRLDVAPETAVRRKPDMSLAESRRRDEASRSFRYPAYTRVVAVDAGMPLGELLLTVKRLIWDAL